MVKTREEIAKFMEGQMKGTIPSPEHSACHYGKCELRQLMDFIFDGPPTCKLERQLTDLKAQQARCAHEWGEAKYNPYTGKHERILHGQYETHGIHMYPRSTFDDVEKPRWTRVCKKCGLAQHTEKQSDLPQPKQKAPDFGA